MAAARRCSPCHAAARMLCDETTHASGMGNGGGADASDRAGRRLRPCTDTFVTQRSMFHREFHCGDSGRAGHEPHAAPGLARTSLRACALLCRRRARRRGAAASARYLVARCTRRILDTRSQHGRGAHAADRCRAAARSSRPGLNVSVTRPRSLKARRSRPFARSQPWFTPIIPGKGFSP